MINSLNKSENIKYFDTLWGDIPNDKVLSYGQFFSVFSKIRKGDYIRIVRNNGSDDIVDRESFIYYKGQKIRAHTFYNILTGVYFDRDKNIQDLIVSLFEDKGINIIWDEEKEQHKKKEITQKTSSAVLKNIYKDGIMKNIFFGYVDLSKLKRKDLVKKYSDGFGQLELCGKVNFIVKDPLNPEIKRGDGTMIEINGTVYSLSSFLDCAIEDEKMANRMRNNYNILLEELGKLKIKIDKPQKLMSNNEKKEDKKIGIDGVMDISWMRDIYAINKVKRILKELKNNKEIFLYVEGLKSFDDLKKIDLEGTVVYVTNYDKLDDIKNEGVDIRVFLGCFRKFLRKEISRYDKLIYFCKEFGFSISVVSKITKN